MPIDPSGAQRMVPGTGGLGLGGGAPGMPSGGDDRLIRLALERLLAQQGGGGGAGGPPPSVINNVYGGAGGGGGMGGSAGVPTAFGGGGIPPGGPGGPAPQGDPYAPDDYMVDIVRQDYGPGDVAELSDPQDPNNVLQRIPFQQKGWVKRVHRWTRPKKKAAPGGMQVDPMAPYGL